MVDYSITMGCEVKIEAHTVFLGAIGLIYITALGLFVGKYWFLFLVIWPNI